MSQNLPSTPPFTPFQIHAIRSIEKKSRDSPTSSILKTPTAVFLTKRGSSRGRTKKLKFANGPTDLESPRQGREGSVDSTSSTNSNVSTVSNLSIDHQKPKNGKLDADGNLIEVAVSPEKSMKVSPDSWAVFLEYKKFQDYSNETEKTDYTYSRLSKYRHKEILPGFPVRPNLSRSPIQRSTNSEPYTLQHTEEYYRRSSQLYGLRQRARTLNFDSEDEVDVSTSQTRERFYSRVTRTVSYYFRAAWLRIVWYLLVTRTFAKDLFAKYIWRSNVYSNVYSHSYSFRMPWSSPKVFQNTQFGVGSSVSRWQSFKTRFVTWIYDSVTTRVTHWQNYINIVKSKTSGTSRKQILLWFLLPLLLLAGLYAVINDSFPHPEAILNFFKDTIPSFFYHVLFVSVPGFATAIPNFVTATVPYYATESFRKTSDFLSSISIVTILEPIRSSFAYLYDSLALYSQLGLVFVLSCISDGYNYSLKYLVLFYSYFCTQAFELVSVTFKGIAFSFEFLWRCVASAFAYLNFS